MSEITSEISPPATSLKKFQLVEWIGPGRKPKTRKIDIVPSSWIKSEKNKSGKDVLLAYFPPYPFTGADKMIKKSSVADEAWETYRIGFVGSSGKYSFINCKYV